jgi:hypothetical protein
MEPSCVECGRLSRNHLYLISMESDHIAFHLVCFHSQLNNSPSLKSRKNKDHATSNVNAWKKEASQIFLPYENITCNRQ